jgi:hypothetical protein
MLKHLLTIVSALAAPVALAAPAFGAQCLEVNVPDSAKAGAADLVLNGLGIRKATFLNVKVYVAGLYLSEKSNDADFKEGHYLSFTNDPAKGVTVDVNGAADKEIQGADFAVALLSIWIGAEPPNDDLKTGLLGGKCE